MAHRSWSSVGDHGLATPPRPLFCFLCDFFLPPSAASTSPPLRFFPPDPPAPLFCSVASVISSSSLSSSSPPPRTRLPFPAAPAAAAAAARCCASIA
eukprot:29526-Pelagococcus_subviridis.AAC.2